MKNLLLREETEEISTSNAHSHEQQVPDLGGMKQNSSSVSRRKYNTTTFQLKYLPY